eukprot:TRINITY_DN10006_c0_g1_i1.p1 TRINITY_DN10006_c0_g1~~TRINITY_DN10006_c0_g1_i1.p1  ORF type:complete len:630 (+),score=99.61 TRINITY_DN10006_c0_g1_i1:281-1891(+)
MPLLASSFLELAGHRAIEDLLVTFLPVIKRLLIDENAQVRLSANNSLISLAGLLDGPNREVHIFPIINKLANDEANEDNRIAAAELLPKTIPLLSPEHFQMFLLADLMKLSKDSHFEIRKSVASHLGIISRAIGTEDTMQFLVPIFQLMSTDEIWSVRKACVESLVDIAANVTPECRSNELLSLYLNLLNDESRWVKSAACQNLGQFVACFPTNEVSPNLVRWFTDLSPNSVSNSTPPTFADSETALMCAFHLPGILVTIGKERWEELHPTFKVLCEDLQFKIRRTLAYSLHEIAKVLGPELTERDLLRPLELFLNDMVQVKEGVLKHIHVILSVLRHERRSFFLPILQEISIDISNWRFRRYLAKQIGGLSTLYPPEIAYEHIVPVLFIFFKDVVNSVRDAAIKQIGPVLKHLDTPGTSAKRDEIFKAIIEFGESRSCYDRQLFVKIVDALAEDLVNGRNIEKGSFETRLLPLVLHLSSDRVANVRLVVSRVLYRLSLFEHTLKMKDVGVCVQRLRQDSDADVAYYSCHPYQPVS